MSNWRWNIGIGPVRYSKPITAPKTSKKASPLGTVVALVVTLGLMYLCCWGGVWYLGRS
ncbi:hypothetical protein AB0H57_24570 [Micromonospora sp. NPDC050686]|uniref:hypothetical protein n=1 Tax=Micromonospora sp. NPDC050686 TaxID=3154631 RepID=UPI0034053392